MLDPSGYTSSESKLGIQNSWGFFYNYQDFVKILQVILFKYDLFILRRRGLEYMYPHSKSQFFYNIKSFTVTLSVFLFCLFEVFTESHGFRKIDLKSLFQYLSFLHNNMKTYTISSL